ARKLRYTGLVIPGLQRQLVRQPRVCVSVGTGWSDIRPIRQFLKAWHRLRETRSLPPDVSAVVFPGSGKAGDDLRQLGEGYAHLFEGAENGVEWGRWESYREEVVRATASVSTCGYNTCYE